MPRRLLRGTAGLVFHVMNRSANRLTLFSTAADYESFLRVTIEAVARVPIRLLAYCVMPNHWHLVVWSSADGDISRWLQWLTMTHAQRWRVAHESVGRGAVYQGRFRWVPVQSDGHLLRACRYVERNPVRAALVARAEYWRWSSLHERTHVGDCKNCARPELSEWPIPRPHSWVDFVNEGEAPTELSIVRRCVARGVPYGSSTWQESTARAIGIPLSGRGRPKKGREDFHSQEILPTLFPG